MTGAGRGNQLRMAETILETEDLRIRL